MSLLLEEKYDENYLYFFILILCMYVKFVNVYILAYYIMFLFSNNKF